MCCHWCQFAQPKSIAHVRQTCSDRRSKFSKLCLLAMQQFVERKGVHWQRWLAAWHQCVIDIQPYFFELQQFAVVIFASARPSNCCHCACTYEDSCKAGDFGGGPQRANAGAERIPRGSAALK